MKQIPNLFTLLNLLFGCIAIVLCLQTNESIITLEATGATQIQLPERLALGALFIFMAAVIDFLDGFLARLMKAQSAMGEQLDSLSDVVSFGVAPGMILYQLLRLSYAQQDDGINVSVMMLLPAFIFTMAAAWRLAKFNISTDQTTSFRGVPTPAAGLVVASFPLIIQYSEAGNIGALFINKWFLLGVIILLSFLMLSNFRLIALKFKSFAIRDNMTRYTLVFASMVLIALMGWLSVPLIFVFYVVLSLLSKERPVPVSTEG